MRGDRIGRNILAFVLSAGMAVGTGLPVFALPHGGKVISGTGSVSRIGNALTILQNSNTLSINWNSFNIGVLQTVNFLQPSFHSVALNFIAGTSASQILGHLTANGQVFLMNPYGIVFGKSAQVNVGGLMAAAMDLDKFAFGTHALFSGSGPVTNAGTIKALPGGSVVFVGGNVTNTGTIEAPSGTVALGAGSTVSLDFSGNDLVDLVVNQNTVQSTINNGGILKANGGKILLKAGAQYSLVASVVNNTGIVEAQSLGMKNGKIVLLSGMENGTTIVAGTLDASAPNGGNGGAIETSGVHVTIAPDSKITTAASKGVTGQWTIDPVDYTIASSGGDITGIQLDSLLASNNITIDSMQGQTGTNGDINVNTGLSWSTHTLTLQAYRNVNFNTGANLTITGGSLRARADDTGTGTGTVVMNGGSLSASGGGNVSFYYDPSSFSTPTPFSNVTTSGGSTFIAYMLVNNATHLQNVSTNLSGDYALGTNITASAFTPIGTAVTPFTGLFNGLDHTINGLTINGPSMNYAGLFDVTSLTAQIRNLTLSNESVTAGNSSSSFENIGGLVGLNNGTISNVTVSGITLNASGNGSGNSAGYGGLVGINQGLIEESSSSGTISAPTNMGGLVGVNYTSGASIDQSFSTANVIVNPASQNSNNCCSVGGLVGWIHAGTISNSYAAGSVSGGNHNYVGGLVGALDGGSVTDSYSVGNVSGTSSTGGFGVICCGGSTGSHDFWNTMTSGQSNGGASFATGMNTSNMQTQANFISATTANGGVNPNWNFTSIWQMGTGSYLYPVLRTPVTPVSYFPLTANITAANKTYDGTTSSTLTGSPSLNGILPGNSVSAVGTASGNFSSPNAASNIPVLYQGGLILSGANASGYLLAGFSSSVVATISTAILSAATTGSKVYDGNASLVLTGSNTPFTGVAGQTATLNTSLPGTLNGANVGTNIGGWLSVTGSDLTGAGGFLSSNYTLPTTFTGGVITPKTLALTGNIANPVMTYNGGTSVTLTPSDSNATLNGFVSGQGASYTGSTGAFSTPNPGSGISVSALLGTGNFSLAGGALWSNYSFGGGTITGTGTINPANSGSGNVWISLPTSTTVMTSDPVTLSGPIQAIGMNMSNGSISGGPFMGSLMGSGFSFGKLSEPREGDATVGSIIGTGTPSLNIEPLDGVRDLQVISDGVNLGFASSRTKR
ncbi:MAG: beta strand repeat-containing protein [Leptospirales bacterium]